MAATGPCSGLRSSSSCFHTHPPPWALRLSLITSLLSQVPPTSLRGRTWALCRAQSSPRTRYVCPCAHTHRFLQERHTSCRHVRPLLPCTHTDASSTTDAHTQTHTDRHARRRSQSLGLARLSAISGPVHWLFALPRRHSRDTCLAQSLNSCLRCRLLEALLGHIAVDACVPSQAPPITPSPSCPLLQTWPVQKESCLAWNIPLPLPFHCWGHPQPGSRC